MNIKNTLLTVVPLIFTTHVNPLLSSPLLTAPSLFSLHLPLRLIGNDKTTPWQSKQMLAANWGHLFFSIPNLIWTPKIHSKQFSQRDSSPISIAVHLNLNYNAWNEYLITQPIMKICREWSQVKHHKHHHYTPREILNQAHSLWSSNT